MDVADLFVASTISNQPVTGSIIVNASRECVLAGGWCPYCKWTHQIHTSHDPGFEGQIMLFWVGAAHISCLHAPSLPFYILDKWNINNQCSTSCVIPGHTMLFLIVFSVLVCPGWSKYSWYQDSTLCCLSQWLRNVDLVWCLCSKEDHTLQCVVLSNEVVLSPFLLVLFPWLLLVLWRSRQYALFIWYY
jgi:hypothetical protein